MVLIDFDAGSFGGIPDWLREVLELDSELLLLAQSGVAYGRVSAARIAILAGARWLRG